MPAEATRKIRETASDPEFGPWLAQASILVVDGEPGMRNFLMHTLGPRCKRLDEAADTEEASRKLDALYRAQGIFRPLERMTGTIAKVESGDLGARTGLSLARDEIGRVALHLDHLLDQLQQRDRQLREWNDELNARVDERTWREDVVTAV